jgi:hypothetical protein
MHEYGDQHLICYRITVTYYDEKDKSETTVLVPVGQNLLEAAHENNVDLEGKNSVNVRIRDT